MRKIFIDFEMTMRKGQIISIGAVDEEGNTFYTLVKPMNLQLADISTKKLTGITRAALMEAPKTSKAFKMFADWVGNYKECFLYTYGNFDEISFRNTVRLNHISESSIIKLQNCFVDVSTAISSALGSNQSISLQHAADELGIEFEQQHNALDDAIALKMVYEKVCNKTTDEIIKTFLTNRIMKEVNKFIKGKPCMYNTKFNKIGSLNLKHMKPDDIIYCLRKSIMRDEELKKELMNSITDIKNISIVDVDRMVKYYFGIRENKFFVINPNEELIKRLEQMNVLYFTDTDIKTFPNKICNAKYVLYNNQDNQESLLDSLMIYEAYRQEKIIYSFNPISIQEIPVKLIPVEFTSDILQISSKA